MTRLSWLLLLGLCAVAKFLVEWLEEHARKRVQNNDEPKERP